MRTTVGILNLGTRTSVIAFFFVRAMEAESWLQWAESIWDAKKWGQCHRQFF